MMMFRRDAKNQLEKGDFLLKSVWVIVKIPSFWYRAEFGFSWQNWQSTHACVDTRTIIHFVAHWILLQKKRNRGGHTISLHSFHFQRYDDERQTFVQTLPIFWHWFSHFLLLSQIVFRKLANPRKILLLIVQKRLCKMSFSWKKSFVYGIVSFFISWHKPS